MVATLSLAYPEMGFAPKSVGANPEKARLTGGEKDAGQRELRRLSCKSNERRALP